jgi:hypothetical protein
MYDSLHLVARILLAVPWSSFVPSSPGSVVFSALLHAIVFYVVVYYVSNYVKWWLVWVLAALVLAGRLMMIPRT